MYSVNDVGAREDQTEKKMGHNHTSSERKERGVSARCMERERIYYILRDL